ncbi:glycerophosphodiester phosphodiesterase [Nocardioides gansuensis]|uniref:Glycerophosphodiester phosphodiesterase n=1 Tax=Nocardioides gansuensis TaxID=2138300 RepID=A0A2T8F992_9ACTN|nr:glycerophosphodiester phosphodiesterase family protein [Nocardioides gansuensis]PVG82296.1 glycerophosphodiester phosphodiesterase [Nocardioides gansuensis]
MRPQVVAHRGASHDTAEHTLLAYTRALEVGAEALECDVRLTADGHLVCVHDRDLRRTAATRGVVSTMNLAELDQLDFASWKNPWAELDDEAPDRDPETGKVLTLRKLLETVADHGQGVELAIETKHPTRYGGLVERRLVELLADFGWDGRDSPVRVMSFSRTAIARIRHLAPDLRVVILIEKAHHWPLLKQAIGPSWILGPGVTELQDHPTFAKALRKSGRDIHVWTVNTPEQLQTCLDVGARAIISDKPAYMIQLLDAQNGGRRYAR